MTDTHYAVGTLGHLLEVYFEPHPVTNLIIYEESINGNPCKLLFDKDCRVHEYHRFRQVKAIYDAEGGGIVIQVREEATP